LHSICIHNLWNMFASRIHKTLILVLCSALPLLLWCTVNGIGEVASNGKGNAVSNLGLGIELPSEGVCAYLLHLVNYTPRHLCMRPYLSVCMGLHSFARASHSFCS
jgi:hypothetical protein